jgi:hypothetical protein
MIGTLDDWCGDLETQMKHAVNNIIGIAVYELDDMDFMTWVRSYPTQILLVALDIRFTKILDSVFNFSKSEAKDPKTGKAVKKKKKK